MLVTTAILLTGASVGTALLGLTFPISTSTNLLHAFMQRIGIMLIATGVIMIFAVLRIDRLELITALVVLAAGNGLVAWSLYFRYSCKPWRRHSRQT